MRGTTSPRLHSRHGPAAAAFLLPTPRSPPQRAQRTRTGPSVPALSAATASSLYTGTIVTLYEVGPGFGLTSIKISSTR